MTMPVAPKARFGRFVYKWSLIAAFVLFAGMIASLVWNLMWPVWTDPAAGEEKQTMAAGIAAAVLINSAVIAVGLGVIGWLVRFALTRERALWPWRKPDGDPPGD